MHKQNGSREAAAFLTAHREEARIWGIAERKLELELGESAMVMGQGLLGIFATQFLGIGAVYCRIKDLESEVEVPAE